MRRRKSCLARLRGCVLALVIMGAVLCVLPTVVPGVRPAPPARVLLDPTPVPPTTTPWPTLAPTPRPAAPTVLPLGTPLERGDRLLVPVASSVVTTTLPDGQLAERVAVLVQVTNTGTTPQAFPPTDLGGHLFGDRRAEILAMGGVWQWAPAPALLDTPCGPAPTPPMAGTLAVGETRTAVLSFALQGMSPAGARLALFDTQWALLDGTSSAPEVPAAIPSWGAPITSATAVMGEGRCDALLTIGGGIAARAATGWTLPQVAVQTRTGERYQMGGTSTGGVYTGTIPALVDPATIVAVVLESTDGTQRQVLPLER